MLQISNLELIHDRDFRTLIDGLNFTVNPGDKIVIIGEEGEGKSTLLKWIYNPELIEGYAKAKGNCITKGEKLAYLPQELDEESKEKTVYEFMQDEHLFNELNPAEIARICKEVGLETDFIYSNQKMGTLSGGEKIKVQFARILAARPSMLLLDEPSNDIDIDTLEWLENYISKSSLGILFVSHDETLIERTANRVIHIEQLNHKTKPRHTVANIPYREYVSERLHGFELQEQQSKIEHRQQRIAEEKWRRVYQRVEHEQNVISRGDPSGGRLLKKKMHTVLSQGRRLEKQRENLTEAPQFEREINIMFDYTPAIYGGKIVLNLNLPELQAPCGVLAENIKLEVRGSDKVCIVGKNGAGKTTLIKIIKDELEKRADISHAYMPQNYEELMDASKTPMEFLEKDGSKEERVMINNRLASLRFTPDDMVRKIGELSGGQRAKLMLLSLTISGADVLIMDEPTRNFSPLSGPVIRKMLSGFPGAIISISHDRKYIEEVATKVYELTPSGLVEGKGASNEE